MGADFGHFADNRAVNMGNRKTILNRQIHRFSQENLRGRAFPLWVAWRKPLPNITLRKGAENLHTKAAKFATFIGEA